MVPDIQIPCFHLRNDIASSDLILLESPLGASCKNISNIDDVHIYNTRLQSATPLSLLITNMQIHRWTVYPVLLLLGDVRLFVSGQSILDTIPMCYQDCIKESGDVICNGIDIKCQSHTSFPSLRFWGPADQHNHSGLCRLSNGNFLTNVITCMKSKCDNNLNTTALVRPVASVCEGEGVPIAPFAIANAISIGSAIIAASTSTLTGATTVTSSFASAGTDYVLAVPLSASSGRSGVRTITGTPSTIKAASITGNSRMSSETSSSNTKSSSSSGSSSSSASSTTTTESSFTTTTVIMTRSSATASPSDGSQATQATQFGGNGTPFYGASSPRQSVDRWLSISVGIGLLVAFVWI